ncbi:hypothetical protein RZN22_11645 [Bacillaceae bacterium S4-13-58]
MRKYVLLMMCLILLSACSLEDDVDFDKTMIVTGKVIQKNEKREEDRAKYFIEVLAIIDQTKESIMLEVDNRNVWNLILTDEVYRISFDTKDGQGYEVNSPIKSIKTVGTYDKTFREKLNDLN